MRLCVHLSQQPHVCPRVCVAPSGAAGHARGLLSDTVYDSVDGCDEGDFQYTIQQPYNLADSDRYTRAKKGGDCAHKLWVKKSDKPFEAGSGTKPRTEMRIQQDFNSKTSYSISFSVKVPEGSYGFSLFQIFSDDPVKLQIRVAKDGKLVSQDGKPLWSDPVFNKWVQVAVSYTPKSDAVALAINGRNVPYGNTRPPKGQYFKLGVYTQDGASSTMTAYFKNIKVTDKKA